MTKTSRNIKKKREVAPINWLKLSSTTKTVHMLRKRFGGMRDSDGYYDSVPHFNEDVVDIAENMFNGEGGIFKLFVTLDSNVTHSVTQEGIRFSTTSTYVLWLIPSDYKVKWLKRGVECPQDAKDSVRCQIPSDSRLLAVTKTEQMKTMMLNSKPLSHDHERSKLVSPLSHTLIHGKLTIYRSTLPLLELLRSERVKSITEVVIAGGEGNISVAVAAIQVLHTLDKPILIKRAISAGIYYMSLKHTLDPNVVLRSHGYRCDDEYYDSTAGIILDWLGEALPSSLEIKGILAAERKFARLASTLNRLRVLKASQLHKVWYTIDPHTYQINALKLKCLM